VLCSLYFSLFNSHLTYGLPVWGGCDAKFSNKLLLLQKKIVRAISFADFTAPTKPIFKELKILRFQDLYKCQLASLMNASSLHLWTLTTDPYPRVCALYLLNVIMYTLLTYGMLEITGFILPAENQLGMVLILLATKVVYSWMS